MLVILLKESPFLKFVTNLHLFLNFYFAVRLEKFPANPIFII